MGTERAVTTDQREPEQNELQATAVASATPLAARVMLVDDHSAFREALAFLLGREPDMHVVGQARTAAEAMGIPEECDIAVVDLDLPDVSGVDLIRTLRKQAPRTKVLVLTAVPDRRAHAYAVEAGAAAIVHKATAIRQIIGVIRALAAGANVLPLEETIELLRLASHHRERDREAEAAIARLTRREREILQLLAEGLSDKGIALRLYVSTETVRTHMVNILGKLGADSRLQALVFAVRHGAVTIE